MMNNSWKVLMTSLLLLPTLVLGQREELKKICQAMDNEFKGVEPLYVQYIMTVVGNSSAPGKESLTFDLYKAGDRSKVKMGVAQDVVQDGKLMVTINHVDQLISVNADTKDVAATGSESMMGIFSTLVDSATKVMKQTDQTYSTYTLYFDKDYIYSVLKFSFYTQSKKPVSLYAEFSPVYTEPYYSMQIDYKKWDHKWKPEPGFPNIEQYVFKKGERYQLQANWKDYQFFQTEKGRL